MSIPAYEVSPDEVISCEDHGEPIAAWTLDELDDSDDLGSLRCAMAGADE